MNKICFLDYHSGNVASIANVLTKLEINFTISNKKKDIIDASHYILPGVGSFPSAMEKINKILPIDIIEDQIFIKKKSIMGICVGMQVMCSFGYEFKKTKGLNWFKNEVKKINSENLPLPHIGWNSIKIKKKSKILENIIDYQDFYFVNSYCVEQTEKEKNIIVATTNYGNDFLSIIEKENILGVQFHPEKSHKNGIKILRNFFKLY
jgi:glutamine amidotransferase